MKKDVSTLVSIHRQTEVQNKPSERSLIVEENNSQKYT